MDSKAKNQNPNLEEELIISSHPTINPYRRSIGTLLNRLKWDASPQSYISRKKIRDLKNKYKNNKAVILCNGPSLLNHDFSAFDGIFTFGLNKINLLFERYDFRPSCVVSVNSFVLDQNKDFYNETDIPLFLDSYAYQHKMVSSRKNVHFLHAGPEGFARDCSVSYCQGFTVTYVALQLAFHMGFDNVALIGADHYFHDKGPANKIVNASNVDNNHFDPRYFSGDMKWQLPDLMESEISYMRALRVYSSFGRSLYNATDGGHLEIFPRLSLSNFLNL